MNNDILTVGSISKEYSICTINELVNMNNDELSKNVNCMVTMLKKIQYIYIL